MSTQQMTTVPSIRPEVTRNTEGHRITTTLNVAEVFGKLHKDVLKSLSNMECSEQFSRRNFAPRDYVDSRGKTYPMFEMTERGFSMLAMSFTGKNAMYWKEAFIEEFFRMRQALETEAQNKFLALENKLKDELLLQNARVYRLQDDNSSLKSILMDQMQIQARKGTRVMPEENQEIKRLFAEGYSKAEISRRTGRSSGIVNRAIKMSASEAVMGGRNVH